MPHLALYRLCLRHPRKAKARQVREAVIILHQQRSETVKKTLTEHQLSTIADKTLQESEPQQEHPIVDITIISIHIQYDTLHYLSKARLP
jgi:hypothetical protein